MIERPAGRTIDWLAVRRRRALERIWRDPMAAQERALRRLVAAARDTDFGLAHGFHGIRSVAEYQQRVPIRDYALPLMSRVGLSEPAAFGWLRRRAMDQRMQMGQVVRAVLAGET